MFSSSRRSLISLKLFLSVGISCLLLVFVLQSLIAAQNDVPVFAAADQIRYVALPPEGNDAGNSCLSSILPCSTIQHALDQAVAGDEIRIAAGTYTDLVTRDGLTQIAYINKSITLSGGYDIGNWDESDPELNETILDAQELGRGIYITGEKNVTVQGLHITNGNAAFLGGSFSQNFDAGGGIYVISATLTLRDSQIYSNTGHVTNSGFRGVGGGLYVLNSTATAVTNSSISSNKATYGAGLYFYNSPNAILNNNAITDNMANHVGGGMKHHGGVYLMQSSNAQLTQNSVSGNIASDNCGGITIFLSHNSELIGNDIFTNKANWRSGGGVCISASNNVQLTRNRIISNTSNHVTVGGGGGIHMLNSDATLTNNIIADNTTTYGDGNGILAIQTMLKMIHNTIANNNINDGYGIVFRPSGTVATTGIFSNTIITGHNVGISVTLPSSVTLHGVLWHSNGDDFLGNVTVNDPITGDPDFVTADYHISAASAARDNGIPTTVFDDIDGEARPFGDAVDLGADEYTTPTVTLLGFQPAEEDGYLFTLRLSGAAPESQYTFTTVHHTDIDYPQDSILVTTDAQGYASAQVWSLCKVDDVLTGYVYAQVTGSQSGQVDSNQVACPSLRLVKDFGTHLTADTANDDWIYRTVPPSSDDTIEIWLDDNADMAGLTGTIRIRSADGNYLLPGQPLIDDSNGRYHFTWPLTSLPAVADYRVQLTLEDGAGNQAGVDGFIKLSGRAIWVWGESEGQENPIIWAIMNNDDYDNNGLGDREEWLDFQNQSYDGDDDPYVTTSYFNVYPYITFEGTAVTPTIQTFLAAAHENGQVRVEALAGTHEWVESDENLAQGKALCDALLAFNRAGSDPAERFDGIHYDLEHDAWAEGDRWPRYIELLTYCQGQVDIYNILYEDIVFGVDLPPHFLTGLANSGAVKSNWDVMNIVDMITLMDYRDFADVRWDGRTDGIIPRAEAFLADGAALGKDVIIGVELTPNTYDHVTFDEECPNYMESELRQVSRAFATSSAYRGLAMHDYAAWKTKAALQFIYLPLVTTNADSRNSTSPKLPVIAVTAVADIDDAVKLTWDTAEQNEAYEVHRETAPAFPIAANNLLDTLDATSTSYIDSFILGDVNTNYFYKVRAIGCGNTVGVLANEVGEFDYAISAQID